MAAAGAAVGLGNVWSFPIQVAENGGAAFVLVYLVLAFSMAYPVLMAELLIGRYAKANPVDAYAKITRNFIGPLTGYWGILTVSLILSFYAIVGGWMIAYSLQYLLRLVNVNPAADWLISFSVPRNIIFCALFSAVTAMIISSGVNAGIERWAKRLMPLLFFIITGLILYVATLEGALAGWRAYIFPDFSKVLEPDLIVGAMGQSFFSLSLAVGTMLVYGSYISRRENLVFIGASVAIVDIGIAILAGLLIIPAMYVAQANGIPIYTEAGKLIGGDGLIFTVLPALFNTMSGLGELVPIAFFLLMIVAALTSSISMLEVPVAYAVEKYAMRRRRATWVISTAIFLFSTCIVLNFELLFAATITATTRYSQPLLGLAICIFAGWLWRRDRMLEEIREGFPEAANSLFWKIWPGYIRIFCPLMIIIAFYRSFVN